MSLSIRRLTEDLVYFHALLFDKEFMKSMSVGKKSEQSLAKPLKFYLAGIHISTYPESRVDELSVPSVLGGEAGHPLRVDYWISGIALEIATLSNVEAVSNPSKLRASNNKSEIKKLIDCDCKSLLCLFDLREFSEDPDFAFLEKYRELARELANGSDYNFNVAYIYRCAGHCRVKSIRVHQGKRP